MRRVCTKGCAPKGGRGGNGDSAFCALRRVLRALGCCFLGDIGAGPGPGLQKAARACVRRPEGGVRGMGEEGPLLSSVLARRPCRCVRKAVTSLGLCHRHQAVFLVFGDLNRDVCFLLILPKMSFQA